MTFCEIVVDKGRSGLPRKFKNPKLIVVITNHNHNENAIKLKKDFSPYADTYLVDSGSVLSEEERGNFDQIHPNIFYSGLYNAAFDLLMDTKAENLLFIASDVTVRNAETTILKIRELLRDPRVGLCGAKEGKKPWVTKPIEEVPYIEGFFFAASAKVMRCLGKIDVKTNRYGWGIDVALGYVCYLTGLKVVQSEGIDIHHPWGAGYDTENARIQMYAWYRQFKGLRYFHLLIKFLYQKYQRPELLLFFLTRPIRNLDWWHLLKPRRLNPQKHS